MTENYSYTAQREIRIYAYLYCAACHSLENAKNIESGSFYQIMLSIVFSAFSLEAYLNHVGERKVEFWEEIEKITPMQKLKVLYSCLGMKFDSSRRPIQTVNQIFKFRNFMAHGRTENIEGTGVMKTESPEPAQNLVETEWEKFCNIKEAARAIEDVKEIIESLCEEAGLEKDPLGSLGTGSRVVGQHRP